MRVKPPAPLPVWFKTTRFGRSFKQSSPFILIRKFRILKVLLLKEQNAENILFPKKMCQLNGQKFGEWTLSMI